MPPGYYRFPTIHQDTIIFASEDDLWSVASNGGIPRRLTSNRGETSRPLLSPDGSLLAFVGREEGPHEIYCMPADGGAAQRLTYLGGTACFTAGWTGDGKIIFANNAGHWYLRFTHLYTVEPGSGFVEQLNFGLARAISYGPHGGVVLGRHTDDPARWKRYRGGTAGQIWIDRTGEGNFTRWLPHLSNLASPMWLSNPEDEGRIYFISDHEGVANLYSCPPNDEDIRRHTHHTDYYIRNASSDGRRIVYHAGADLFVYDPISDQDLVIPIAYHSPQVQRSRKFVNPSRYLQDAALHPNGQALAISARGKVFSFANWEGAVTEHGAFENHAPLTEIQTSVRYRQPEWLNDGKRIIAINDQGGEESFVIWNADGSDQPHRLEGLDIGRPIEVKVNPKKDQIAFSNHRYELCCLDLENRTLRLVDKGAEARIAGFDWSPDGEWIAYSISVNLQVWTLKLWQSSTGESFPLTKPVLRDLSPSFDPQGKYIYFLSYRTFDPVYDNLQFDLGFPLGSKPYLITLQKDQTSPFIPQPKLDEDEKQDNKSLYEKFLDEDPENPGIGEEKEDGEATESPEENQPEPEEISKEKPLQIDLDGIEQRVIAFPISEGIYGQIKANHEGKVLYTRFPMMGSLSLPIDSEPLSNGTLFSYNFEELKEELVVSGVSSFEISRNGKSLLYRSGNRLRVIKAGEKPNGEDGGSTRKSGWINLDRVSLSVLPGAEWRQMFREAWRLQRDHFWTPDMSQIDWIAVHDRYLPLVDRVGSRSEFSDLMWEMQGELGTSHAYEFGGDYRPEPVYQLGFIGADLAYDPTSDGWTIRHIYQGDVWSQDSDSPLNKPGINIKVGDRLLAINGRRLSRLVSPSMALVNLAGDEIGLTILAAGEQDSSLVRKVVIKTLTSEMNARYREWVETNRQLVHQATQGRIGYVHIPDMMGKGYAEFHRGFLAEVVREGLIIDVRFNRGGHVSARILEKLARKRIGYDTTRWGKTAEPYPPESVLGPIVALTNEYAGSDGDIFSHGFKLMKLGPLVGMRTWGGVVGIWPRHALVDGTLTTQPEFSFWFSDVGWSVENYGTDPDIVVDIEPQDYESGRDAQLERAIAEAVYLLETNPPKLPDFSNRPNLALPKLPK